MKKTFLATFGVLLACTAMSAAGGPKFYPDDPLPAEPKPRDASKAVRRKISDYYDFFSQTFTKLGEQQGEKVNGKVTPPIPAQAVNTLGEPMKSVWWEPRHYFKKMSIEELVRGPGNSSSPSKDGKWKVVKAKSEGVTPGFEIVDSKNRRYVLKFDPVEFPEMATGPDVLVSKLMYALGYHVPENYIVHFSEEDLELGTDVQFVDAKGKVRKMTNRDVTELLMHVPKGQDGKYRGGASLYLAGKPVGPYKYYGTRKDDPNDTVPHEHRRDLRGFNVACAWVNHDDSRAINSQDMLVTEGGVGYVKHHLIDFGATLGSSSSRPNSPRGGHEYMWDPKLAAKQFFTFGLLVPYWAKAKYPDHLPAVGRFESKVFRADQYYAEYRNPAFVNMLPDDAFWMAKQVMALSDADIRAIVKTGEYSDPAAEKWIADALIERRDKIGKAFFPHVLPLDRFRVEGGKLAFDDLARRHGMTASPGYTTSDAGYKVEWSTFNNGDGTMSALTARGVEVPQASGASYLMARVQGQDAKKTISVYLRRGAGSWQVVGVERGW